MTKHTKRLREISKFFAGLVAADLAGAIWFAAANITDFEVFGIVLTPTFINMGIAIDSFLLLVLIHYAWHPKVLEPNISRRVLFIVVGVITGVVAVVHVGRLVFGLDLILGNWNSPMWLSWMGAIITAYISYVSFHFAGRR